MLFIRKLVKINCAIFKIKFKFAHDDHQLLMELKDPAFDLIHGTDSNDENLILGLSSFSLGQSIKGVPQKEIENIGCILTIMI